MPFAVPPAITTRKPIFTPGRKVNWEHPLNRGLAAWWLTNEVSGLTVYDVVERFPLAYQGTPPGDGNPFSTYQGRRALRLDKDNSNYANWGVDPVLSFPLTLCGWFNVDNITETHSVLSIGSPSTTNRYIVIAAAGLTTGDPCRAIASTSTAAGASVSASAYTANAWHFLVGVFNSTTSRFCYLNGVPGSEETTNIGSFPACTDMRIGLICTTGTSYVTGAVDNLSIYRRALSQEDILSLYSYPYGTPNNPRLI